VAVPPVVEPLVEEPARAGLFLDFDGTLSPIVPDPADARMVPAARAALARLVPRLGRVAVVSGRPARFLREALAVDGVEVVGAYGLERIVDGRVVVDERVQPHLVAVRRAADEATDALPGVRIERKGALAVALHWREHPQRGLDASEWAVDAAARYDLDLVRGRMAIELRPALQVDKGTTVAGLARGLTTAAFAGDDVGDLPAFAALKAMAEQGELAHAVTIGVMSDESPPEVGTADAVVDGPIGFARLLHALADAITSRA
jgi:trehalose 6-phosphate phosphatase